MEVFIVGHEYAHILLGHVNSNFTKKNLLNDKIETLLFSWKQEYNADELGFPLMLDGLRNVGYENDYVSYCGAEAFFSAFEVLERAKCLIKSGDEEQYWRNCSKSGEIGDHPSSEKRRDALRIQMTQVYGEEPIRSSQIVESIIKILWERTKPNILTNQKKLYLVFLSNQVETKFTQKKYSEALESLEKILELEPSHIPALFGKGNIFQHFNRLEKSDQCYDEILKIEKENIGALVQKSNIQFTKEEYQKALETANIALKIENQNPYALYAKGMALNQLERDKEAIISFKQILISDKSHIPALLRIAFSYAMIMEPKTAIEYYDKVLEIEPNHVDAIEQKMTMLEHLEDYDGILKMIDVFLKETPNDQELLEIRKEFEDEKQKSKK